MSDENKTVTEDQLYSLSDEQFAELDESQILPSEEESAEIEDNSENEAIDQNDDIEDEDFDESTDGGDEDESTDTNESSVDNAFESEDESVEEDTDSDITDKEDESSESDEIDYKEAYEKLTQPFKANGKEMKVDNVDDAIQLMQMGANYTKKMAALKPNLKLLKMLENNQLLDEEKLGFYIDIERKDPEAIKKLLKDSKIDPMDLDLEEESQYKPKRHTVDDRQVDLDMVVDEIRESEHYPKTIDVVSKKWDGASKQAIYENPQLIKVINDHMESGVYDVIESELDRERTLGRLTGLSDLEAYRQVGDAIQARGGFDHLFQGQEQRQKQPVKRKAANEGKRKEDPKVKQKRKAASPTRSTPDTGKKGSDYNPLALSDDEFEKLIDERFM